MSEITIVLEQGLAEIKIKKSTFIGLVAFATTQEEALAIITRVKKEHYNATHNCSAYIVDNGRTEHQNDDGEPSGTAGKPMLEVLKGAGLVNCVAVVTRYFGGVLLGTGGLVRAYTQAVQEALSLAVLGVKRLGCHCGFRVAYTHIGKLKYKLSELGIFVVEERYTSEVELDLLIPEGGKEAWLQNLTDITSADYRMLFEKDVEWIMVNHEAKIL